MKNIIGFDSWTGGNAKYARLVPAFRQLGYRLILIHLGSWGGDTGRPKSESLGELDVRDIGYYHGLRFDQILDREQPAAVIFLSNEVFAHRAFNRYCAAKGIPTLLLYHGLVGVQALDSSAVYRVNVLNQASFVLRRIPKALTRVWPCYARALLATHAGLKDWIRFVADILVLARGRYIEIAAADSRTTRCAVYTMVDVAHAESKYGFPAEFVEVVGNPDLQAFALEECDVGKAASGSTSDRDVLVYVDTGLIYAGMVFSSAEDFLAHLIATRNGAAKAGKRLAIKLHPQHFRTDLPSRLNAAGIEVLSNANFVSRLRESAAAIVEPSTAAIIPGLVGLPLLLSRYGKLSGQLYGQVLMSHPRAQYLDCLDDIGELLRREASALNPDAVWKWIEANVGPLPAEDMPSRVAKLVHNMVGRSRDDKCAG